MAARGPRLLVTGFGPFPGAPVNPTEALIAALAGLPETFEGADEIRAEALPVEYAAVPARLDALGAAFAPDIAVHFGLSGKARGFTLERRAQNVIAGERADNAGMRPHEAMIVPGGGDVVSRLPLEAVRAALAAEGLPVSWSHDAGGYLCNYLFYLSCGHMRVGFAPGMAGFVHVPPLKAQGEGASANAMALSDLIAGARVIIGTCVREWRKRCAA